MILSVEAIDKATEWVLRNKISTYYPEAGPLRRELYPRHLEFFEKGATCLQRLAISGNRTGKTSGLLAYETTLHLTQDYPHWWKGRRFKKPINAWLVGKTSETTRDILQVEMLGPIERAPGSTEKIGLGFGMIPADRIISTAPKAGVPGAVDTVWVKCRNGGVSSLGFKSYGTGSGGQRDSFEGVQRQWIGLDEESPQPIMDECLMRTMSTVPGELSGSLVMTFTPLEGYTSVVKSFLESNNPDRWYTQISWADCAHLSADTIATLSRNYLPSQLKARSQGIPAIGEGAIYPIDIDEISVDPFTIPDTWPRCFGMDVGKTAVVWIAHDRDSDVAYAYSEHFSMDYNTTLQVEAIKARGIWIPGFVDPSSLQSNQMDGQKLFDIYKAKGLNIQWEKTGVESGIGEIWNRLSTGRLKFFSNLALLRKEFQRYHRSKSETVFGVQDKIVKKDDHLVDALRYGIVSALPHAKCHFTPKLSTPDIFQRQSGSLSSGDGGWMGQ